MLGADAATRDAAEEVVREALAVATRTGLGLHAAHLDVVAALNAQRRGDWQAAVARYDAALAACQEPESPSAGTPQHFARAAILGVHRDDLNLARERLAVAQAGVQQDRAAGVERNEHFVVFLAEAQLRLATGDPAAALVALDELAGFVDRRGIGFLHLTVLPAALAIARDGGAPDAARIAVERAESWLRTRQHPEPEHEQIARWGRAVVGGDPGDVDDVVGWADGPRPLWEWRPLVREDAAAVLTAAGERDRAIGRLREAVELWEQAGAARDVARVRQALRSLGVRRGRGLASDRPATGLDSLTGAEWRVVALVAEGLIYREVAERLFLSRRTVEAHMARVFRKLDVSSRRELTTRLRGDEGQALLAAHR